MFKLFQAPPLTCFQLIPGPPPLLGMQEDETGHLRNVLEKDVVTAWHTYMGTPVPLPAWWHSLPNES